MRIYYIILVLLFSCNYNDKKINNQVLLNNEQEERTLFEKIITIGNLKSRLNNQASDSLSVLVLPLEASCPSCRNKTIDGIMRYADNLTDNSIVILSAKAGIKNMNAFFRERGYESIPVNNGKIILDSTNQANGLYENNTTIYYASQQRVYKIVSSVPATIKNDLHEFFSR